MPPGSISRAGLTTPPQTELLRLLSGFGMQSGQELAPRMFGDPNQKFDPYAQASRQGFQKAVPTIAERFVNMNSPQGQQFASIIGAGATGVERDLGAQRSQFAMNRRNQQLGLLETLLGFGLRPQFEPIARQKPVNPFMQMAGIGAQVTPLLFGRRK